MFEIMIGIGGLLVGLLVILLPYLRTNRNIETALKKQDELLKEADEEASRILSEANVHASEGVEEVMNDLANRERHLMQHNDRYQQKTAVLDSRLQKIDSQKHALGEQEKSIQETKEKLHAITRTQIEHLEKVTKSSFDSVAEQLIALYGKKFQEETAEYWKEEMSFLMDNQDKYCDKLTKLVIQRYSAGSSREAVAVQVDFKSKKNRSRILGENEETFFNELNQKLEADLTYEWDGNVLEIYGHDLLKRNIVKLMLQNLLKKPSLGVDNALSISKQTISADLVKHGNWAVRTLKIDALPEQLVKLIGRLNYRTSYGQNILKHSIEVAFICEILASELGADPQISKLGGLLHDIGKAIDTEITGAHDAIGRDIALKFNLDPIVINCIYAHHEAEPFKSIESRIVQVADAISASRPGARHQESLEDYMERIEKLESITEQFPGIDKSYAISAGRELRVLVDPETVSDEQAREIAKSIASRIENELTYPGEIKVNLIREKKVIDYAN